jgi:hypothetical protein
MAWGRKMRRMALFGTVMALVLALAIAVPVFGAPPSGIPSHPDQGHRPVPPLAVGTTLTISGSGTAYKIGNKTTTESASISLTATVVKSSPGRGMLNFTSGTLTIGSDTYTVVSGHGMINYHSDKMVLHLVVKNSAGKMFHLNLFGVHAKASSTTAFSVDFRMPQSKLAHLWFLKFPSASVTPK